MAHFAPWFFLVLIVSASLGQFNGALKLRFPTSAECTPLRLVSADLVSMAVTPKEAFVVLRSHSGEENDELQKYTATDGNFFSGPKQTLNATTGGFFFLPELDVFISFKTARLRRNHTDDSSLYVAMDLIDAKRFAVIGTVKLEKTFGFVLVDDLFTATVTNNVGWDGNSKRFYLVSALDVEKDVTWVLNGNTIDFSLFNGTNVAEVKVSSFPFNETFRMSRLAFCDQVFDSRYKKLYFSIVQYSIGTLVSKSIYTFNFKQMEDQWRSFETLDIPVSNASYLGVRSLSILEDLDLLLLTGVTGDAYCENQSPIERCTAQLYLFDLTAGPLKEPSAIYPIYMNHFVDVKGTPNPIHPCYALVDPIYGVVWYTFGYQMACWNASIYYTPLTGVDAGRLILASDDQRLFGWHAPRCGGMAKTSDVSSVIVGVWREAFESTSGQFSGWTHNFCQLAVDNVPSLAPTASPTEAPTGPTLQPTESPTVAPTQSPTENPTRAPTEFPTGAPTNQPTPAPTNQPTGAPTEDPVITKLNAYGQWLIALTALTVALIVLVVAGAIYFYVYYYYLPSQARGGALYQPV